MRHLRWLLATLALGSLVFAGVALAKGGNHTTTGTTSTRSNGFAQRGPFGGPPGPGGPGFGPRGPRGGPGAGPGDGVVTAKSDSSLTVKNAFGESQTFSLSSSTVYHYGPLAQASASDVTDGTRVHVGGYANGSTLVATDVDIHLAHVDGTVKSVSSGTIAVTDMDGFTRTIAASSSTRYDKGGSSASSVSQGDVISAAGSVDSNGTTLDARYVEIRVAPQQQSGYVFGR